jgi:acyl-CoA synthetase (NDP forming)
MALSNVDLEAARKLIVEVIQAGQSALDEAEAKKLLRLYGVAVPAGSVADNEEDARDTAEMLGFPVVIKAVSSCFQHKTEAGLVIVGVRDDAAVRAAFAALRERAGCHFQGVLVERMIKAERELMVGMTRDPAFGPAVAFGVGGVWTEAMGDIAVGIAPLSDNDAIDLMGLVRASKMLGAARGYPAVDRGALVQVLQAVGQIAMDHPEVAEIDINPLMTEKGRPVAADALVILSTDGGAGRSTQAQVDTEAYSKRPGLRSVFSPESVAVVGASSDPAKWGGSLLKNIIDGGYAGSVYPINPRGGTMFGLPVFASLEELPAAPDLAIIAVGAPHVEDTIIRCGQLGVHGVVVISAGFSEVGPEGALLEAGLSRAAHHAQIAVVGPNCMGVISNELSLHATGFVSLHPHKGGLSVISQSGNVGYKLLKMADGQGAGIAKFVGVGNQAVINSVDVLEYLSTDPETDVILMYLEGVKDGHRLMEIARRTTSHKPIVVVRGGMTAFGTHAAASHTGAMAGAAAVREASAWQTGAIGTTSPEEGIDIAIALENLPLPKGRRVAIITLGGGWGVLAADEVARNGLVLAELPQPLLNGLNQLLPPFWSHGNPIDLVTSGDAESIEQVVELVTQSESVDAVLVLGVIGSPVTSRYAQAAGIPRNEEGLNPWDAAYLSRVADLIASSGKPVIHVPLEPLERSVFMSNGRYSPVAVSTVRAGAQVVGRMAWYSGYLQSREPQRA